MSWLRCWASCFCSGAGGLRRRQGRCWASTSAREAPPSVNWLCTTLSRIGLDLDDRLGRGDLAAQRGEVDRRDDHIGGERQVGRLELIALIFCLRGLRLDGAPRTAEDVGRVGDVERGRRDAIVERRSGWPNWTPLASAFWPEHWR